MLDFVLRDDNFPQSMAAALARVDRLVTQLPHQRVSTDLLDGIVEGLRKLDLKRLTPDVLTQNMDWIQQGWSNCMQTSARNISFSCRTIANPWVCRGECCILSVYLGMSL